MSFDRFRVQLQCEAFFSCTTPEQWEAADFKSLVLTASQATLLSTALKEDTVDLYFKGVLSLIESIRNFNDSKFSWATIKSYYATFYLLRAELAAKQIGLIRNKSIFYLNCATGASPIKKSNARKYGTDHKATLNYYIDLFANRDILLSQNIDNKTAYEWLMEKREQVNYRERVFHEPFAPDFLSKLETIVQAGQLHALLNDLIIDKYVLTFQEEYSTIAIPLKRAILTKDSIEKASIKLNYNSDKLTFLKSILPFKIPEIEALIQ